MNARDWPLLRRRTGRHGDRVDIAQAPAALKLAAALPVPQSLLERPRPAAPVPPPRREPVTEVTCEFCGVTGLSSAIPAVPTRGHRCADTDACARRWGNKEAATRLAGDAAPPDPGAHPYPAPEAEPVTEEPAPVAELEPSVCPGDYLDGREDDDELDLPRLEAAAASEPAPAAEPEPEPAAPEVTTVLPVTEAPTEAVPVIEADGGDEK